MDRLALELVDSIATVEGDGLQLRSTESRDSSETESPVNVHRFQHDQSILSLALTTSHIFAGTQAGEIIVRLPILRAGFD
jgi:hypothetical protein